MSDKTAKKFLGYWLGWISTPIHLTLFALILCGFHPILKIASYFGMRAYMWVHYRMCLSLMLNMQLTGSKIKYHCDQPLPVGTPLILVCNHQSMYDIPIITWLLRRQKPNFISKRELARGLPTISLSLRTMKSCLIDRKNPAEAIPAIEEFGTRAEKEKFMVCIFPEGTRARDGVLKKFKPGGLQALVRSMPSALVVPAVIDGCWELLRYKLQPVPIGITLSLTVLAPIDPKNYSKTELNNLVETRIRERLELIRTSGT